MKELTAICGTLIQVSDEDYDYLRHYEWILHKSYIIMKQHSSIVLHVTIALRMGLVFLNDIDHKDRNYLNNQRDNLRAATYSQNSTNRSKIKNTSSQYKGVSWAK